MFYVKNVPGWERVVRVIAGLVVAGFALFSPGGVAGIAIAVAAAGIVVSGLVGFCPACALAGRKLARQAAQARPRR
ncbi:YgaP family membrane protein [Cupriavidus sp. 30B13]|uniref:YgaP family membrane protein n=1 Tax=Cupriavidus sp. 30B13 TaxID=3384241 RepID=UPI003B91A34E